LPSRQEWIDSLYREYQIIVSSSPALVADVQRKQIERKSKLLPSKIPPMKPPIGVPIFQHDLPVNIKPIELLLSIGLISSSPISSLVDICSTWAIVRYIWAFQPQNNDTSIPYCKLSEEARKIDFHQKSLLSDEIGVGFAHFLMINYLNAINPVDISYVLQNQGLYSVKPKGTARPDYLFFDENSGMKYVVECKGTQTSRAESIHQLQRGMEQVTAIQPTDGQTLNRYVVATCMQKKKTTTYILDPPNDNSIEQRLNDYSKDKKALSVEGKSFRRDTRLIGRANMLAFAGLNEEALKTLPEQNQKKVKLKLKNTSETKTVETEQGNYDGTTITFDYKDGIHLEIFRGISTTLRQNKNSIDIVENDDLTNDTEPSEFEKENKGSFKEKRCINKKNEYSVRSQSRDGAILEIKING
jgi:hypothetical protein